MSSFPRPDHERPVLCELLSITSCSVGGTGDTVSSREYVECANDTAGRYRVRPDAGGTVDVWLCTAHAAECESYIVETIEER